MFKCLCVSLETTTGQVNGPVRCYNRPSLKLCIKPYLALNVDVMARVNTDLVECKLDGKPSDYLSSSC
jgi:hypothetical protein